MIAIIPVTLNSSNITSDAPTSNDPSAWLNITAYVRGNRVSVLGTTNKIYECVTNVTGGYSPEVDITKLIPVWVLVGSTNKYAMFDSLKDTFTVTTTATSITVTATLALTVTSLAFIGMKNVTTVTVDAYTSFPTGNVYSNVFTIVDGYGLTLKIPNSNNLTIVMLFSGVAPLSVGNMVVGTHTNIGLVHIGASSDIINFSLIDRDTYGIAKLIPRRSIPKTSQKLFINKSRVDALLQFKKDVESVPCLWSGLNDQFNHPYFKALLVLGIYRDFSFQLDNPIGPIINLDLEEI